MKALAGQGARLAVSGSNVDKLERFRKELGGDHVAIGCNLSDGDAVDSLVPSAVDALDDVESGSFSIRKAALGDRIADLSDEIGRKEDAFLKYEERLRAQYAALDGLLRRLQGQTSFLSGQTS